MEVEGLLLKRREAIAILGIAPITFEKLDIPFIKVGTNKRYYKKTLIEWIENELQKSKEQNEKKD